MGDSSCQASAFGVQLYQWSVAACLAKSVGGLDVHLLSCGQAFASTKRMLQPSVYENALWGVYC